MWNTCLRSGGGWLLGGILVTYFVSVHGSKLGVRKVSVGRTMVRISGFNTGVKVLGQEYVMHYGKDSAEVQGGGYGASTIMEFCNLKGYDVGCLLYV